MPDTAIICLSSIPPRMALLGPTLDSLLRQSPAPAEVRLYLPQRYRRFPDWDGRLPAFPAGVRVFRPEADLGPGTKILPALSDTEGDPWLAFCDDDCRYPQGWLQGLLTAATEHPGCAIAAAGQHLPGLAPRADRQPRMRRHSPDELAALRQEAGGEGPVRLFASSGYVDALSGWAGALVRPSFFAPDADQIPPRLWSVDDIWLSAQLERRGVPIWLSAEIPPIMRRPAPGRIAPLVGAVIEGMDRKAANEACADHARRAYGIWPLAKAPGPQPLWKRAAARLRRALRG